MKHLSFLIFLLIYNSSSCQTYKFDQLSTFDLVGKNKVIASTQKLTNSRNLYYSMDFKSGNSAELVDNAIFYRHFFNVVKQANDKFLFNYVRSCDEKEIHEDIKNIQRDYRIKEVNDNNYNLGKYDSAELKNSYFEIKFQVEETISNQLGLLSTIEFELLEKFLENIDIEKKYSIKKLDYYVNGKKGKELKLKDVIATNIEIILPSKLTFKCLSK